eukprot:TRINITY_DN48648_c0_g1_i1.p1 TRINITY_DN48648_c0_g1~~TRINITY_DN48648_c0_g1_i1.p1  ORF type:complete len:534 (+),score=82.40 TRINITY_DN48648_c0_g1_i1:23-1603(+)
MDKFRAMDSTYRAGPGMDKHRPSWAGPAWPSLVGIVGEESQTGTVSFNVECHTVVGEQLLIIGSVPELGNWNIRGAVQMLTSEDEFPMWTSPPLQLSLPAQGPVLYKYVISKGGDTSEVEWEDGLDRTIEERNFAELIQGASTINDLAVMRGTAHASTLTKRTGRVRSRDRTNGGSHCSPGQQMAQVLATSQLWDEEVNRLHKEMRALRDSHKETLLQLQSEQADKKSMKDSHVQALLSLQSQLNESLEEQQKLKESHCEALESLRSQLVVAHDEQQSLRDSLQSQMQASLAERQELRESHLEACTALQRQLDTALAEQQDVRNSTAHRISEAQTRFQREQQALKQSHWEAREALAEAKSQLKAAQSENRVLKDSHRIALSELQSQLKSAQTENEAFKAFHRETMVDAATSDKSADRDSLTEGSCRRSQRAYTPRGHRRRQPVKDGLPEVPVRRAGRRCCWHFPCAKWRLRAHWARQYSAAGEKDAERRADRARTLRSRIASFLHLAFLLLGLALVAHWSRAPQSF